MCFSDNGDAFDVRTISEIMTIVINIGKHALLILENGSIYKGFSFGYEINNIGEVCFNTSMSGYQEILTDPSYYRQIVTLTYPMIGNYGIDPDVSESDKIHVAGLVVKEYVPNPSNFTSCMSLAEFLRLNQVPGIQGLDTRKLVREIRSVGAMRGGIFMESEYKPEMMEQIKSMSPMKGSDLATSVSTPEKYIFGEHGDKKYRVAVIDFGVKTNILRMLDKAGFAVEVFPAKTPATELLSENFDCFFLSNGPGDPEPLQYAVETVKVLMESKKPIFGICLGHQLIGLAGGGTSYKLKFGHRGGNQPVKNLISGRVEITSQNHGFAIEKSGGNAKLSHISLNDETVEGFLDEAGHIMCVQYHPEACPGPHDAAYLFDEFYNMVERYHSGNVHL